ncbi:MAG: PDZ domain-containing protein [Planctomycetota bacterium]|nr:PDZ domain-containing protein [Planctomycetota bacterium]
MTQAFLQTSFPRFVFLSIFLVVASASFGDDEKSPETEKVPGYLGVYMEAAQVSKTRGAIRLSLVVPNSPAELGGLKNNDMILGFEGRVFNGSKDKVLESFKAYLKGKAAGESLTLTIERVESTASWTLDQSKVKARTGPRLPNLDGILERNLGKTLSLTAKRQKRNFVLKVKLGARARNALAKLPQNSTLRPGHEDLRCREDAIVKKCLSLPLLKKTFQDVQERFEKDEHKNDSFRARTFRYLHRAPTRVPGFGRQLGESWRSCARSKTLVGILEPMLVLLDESEKRYKEALRTIPGRLARPKSGATVHDHLNYIIRHMERAAHFRSAALKRLSKEERAFLAKEGFENLKSRFTESIYLHTDPNKDRWRINLRVLDLLGKIDSALLSRGSQELLVLGDRGYLGQLKTDLSAFYKGTLQNSILYAVDHSIGSVRILGTGPDVLRARANLVIDLGGHDVYAAPVAAARGDENPVAVCLDLAGDDQYQSTTDGNLGAGILGLAMLVDLEGDDVYLSSASGSQGMAFAGAGFVIDWSGNDDYRGAALCQGSVLAVGVGALLDFSGDDVLSGTLYSQGFAGPSSVGLCLQNGGDDRYLGGMGQGSSYGSRDVYQGFCQGVACGFRGYASGGFGALLDTGGDDRYLAGNFSQGGGYYFGMGLLWDYGRSDDRFVGSRYAQAFSAHSAIGFLLDDGGDDRYQGVIGALQGAAWDLSISVFIDEAGNDDYWGMNAFSLGASAHNGLSFFFDHGGCDRYRNSQGLGRAGPNDYHGGVSLSLFVDAGAEKDRYLGPGMAAFFSDRRARLRGKLGLVVDVNGDASWTGKQLREWLGSDLKNYEGSGKRRKK